MHRLSPTCSRARRWRGSRSFQLGNNKFGDEGAAAVAAAGAAGGLPQVNQLVLNANDITDAGMQALASAFAGGAFHKLKCLSVGVNAIGDAGLILLSPRLSEKGALPALKELYLWGNQFGDEGLKALMAAVGEGWLAKLEKIFVSLNVTSSVRRVSEAARWRAR